MLKVLYEDAEYVAVDKPSGMLVHRTGIAAATRVCAMTELRDQLGKWVYPVHRLDRATSGVLLFGLSSEAAALLAESYREKSVRKVYHAVVRGFTPESGRLDKPLRRNPLKKNSPHVDALSEYKRLATSELAIPIGQHLTARYSLLEIETHTGRMHQIRRHFRSASYPLIGDTVYGDGRHNRLFRENFGINRLLLSASRIEIIHPFSKKTLKIEAESTVNFSILLRPLGLEFIKNNC